MPDAVASGHRENVLGKQPDYTPRFAWTTMAWLLWTALYATGIDQWQKTVTSRLVMRPTLNVLQKKLVETISAHQSTKVNFARTATPKARGITE